MVANVPGDSGSRVGARYPRCVVLDTTETTDHGLPPEPTWVARSVAQRLNVLLAAGEAAGARALAQIVAADHIVVAVAAGSGADGRW